MDVSLHTDDTHKVLAVCLVYAPCDLSICKSVRVTGQTAAECCEQVCGANLSFPVLL